MESKKTIRECPQCKEDIKADAIKCKHCGSAVAPERLPHGGICTYCKEEIKKDAIKCKHCKSDLSGNAGCGCKGDTPGKKDTEMIRTMLRMDNFGFGPDPKYRACQNTCSSDFFDCYTGASDPLGRDICKAFLHLCSLRCQFEDDFGSGSLFGI
ncbi:double zinc ribbon domain-containing protein [Flavobacteriaceae bacterium M23B6Z8]